MGHGLRVTQVTHQPDSETAGKNPAATMINIRKYILFMMLFLLLWIYKEFDSLGIAGAHPIDQLPA